MDLSSMLNDGPPAEKPKSSAPQSTPPIGGSYGGSFAPPSTSTSQAQGRNLTPLHTPNTGQYPFPSPSPINTASGQQAYRPYEAYSATTPGGRPASHGIYPHPSPSQYGPPVQTHQTTSMSPTPSSHHSQTPHSMRQSPLTTMNHLPQQHQQPSHYHHSQPSTPLGPPPLVQRHSNHIEIASPYHQRHPSGASNGMIANSPAQYHPSIGNLVESPNVLRPSSQRRRTSDFRSSIDRDRSESVSPKTKVPARPPSSGSRQSSQQESYSARSSMQTSASVAPPSTTPSHVTAPSSSSAQPLYSNPAGEVTQAHSQASGSLKGNVGAGGPLSVSNNQPAPQHHQSAKMGMNHLLAPTQHEQYHENLQQANSASHTPQSASHERRKENSHPSPANLISAPTPLEQTRFHMQSEPPVNSNYLPTPASSLPSKPSQSQPPETRHQASPMSSTDAAQMKMPLKRTAESEPIAEPPAKRGRTRKYTERPIWAHLSPQNPRSREAGVVPNGAQPSKSAAAPVRPSGEAGAPPQQTNGRRSSPQPNGHAALDVPPWQQDPPLDHDLMRARKILGPRWEKSIQWNVPLSSLVKSLMDWLFASLNANSDIGLDPREGAIEIEAKIGTLVDTKTGERMVLPVLNAVVLDPRTTDRYAFESQMFEAAHARMNQYLNESLIVSQKNKGRTPIDYKHIKETDSFRTLSQYGISLLPQSAQRRFRRELRLRTSVDQKTRQVTARIVKVKLAELQIHSPGDSYDCRISMNLEVNLDRPGIDVSQLTEEPTHEKPAQPDRVKDRLSYKHTAYSTDLTRVDTKGLSPKYELELEVDANLLRQQKELLQSGQENGFQAVVEGFMENLTLLMRQPKQ